MHLPEETLAEIKETIERLKENIAKREAIIADLRAAGIDALRHEEVLERQKAELRKWEVFYELQSRRMGK